MPYAPGIDYRGDQYIYQGISKLGDLFSGAIDKTQELRKQAALNDTIVAHALNNGLINQDEYNKYVQAPWAKKQGVANGIMANMHDDWQRKQFAAEQADKAAQRALQLQIAHMAHDPSPNAYQPIFGPAPAQDPAYADRGLDMTPTGEPVPTTGPQVGVWGDKGQAYMFPWREVTGATNPDGTVATPVVDNSLLPGSSVITMPGSKQLKIVPNNPAPPGTIMTGEGIPENTFAYGAGRQPVKLDKATTRRLNAAAATPPPTPTPFAAGVRSGLPTWFPGSLATPTPTPMVGVPPAAAPAQTPIPTVVAPPPPAAIQPGQPDASGFIVGKPYKDKDGNVATYLGNGQWQ